MYTDQQVAEWKAKAEKWDKLSEAVGHFYIDAEGNVLPDDEVSGDLCDVGEVAAYHLGYLC